MTATVYVDLEGAVMDLRSGLQKVHPNIRVEYAGREYAIPGLFVIADPQAGAIAALRQLEQTHDVFLVSTAPHSATSDSEKLRWVNSHVETLNGALGSDRLIFTTSKRHLPRQSLIDNASSQDAGEFQGQVISLFTADCPDWNSAVSRLAAARSSAAAAERPRIADRNVFEASPTAMAVALDEIASFAAVTSQCQRDAEHWARRDTFAVSRWLSLRGEESRLLRPRLIDLLRSDSAFTNVRDRANSEVERRLAVLSVVANLHHERTGFFPEWKTQARDTAARSAPRSLEWSGTQPGEVAVRADGVTLGIIVRSTSRKLYLRDGGSAAFHELKLDPDLAPLRNHFARGARGTKEYARACAKWVERSRQSDVEATTGPSVQSTGAPALRTWQADALRAWRAHGHRGVVEAVTGTGKSRVGIEAIREALDDGYFAVVMVPTIDLVEQWVRSLREHGVQQVGAVGDGERARFDTHRVLVGTVQSFYVDPPTRISGKVLLVADECHRYGAERWRQALHHSYPRRLGLTATFERSDDGIDDLYDYFGGPPIYEIGFEKAISDGVVAHYNVKLVGVDLAADEQRRYDQAEKTLSDSRLKLVRRGFSPEPFGVFMAEVQRAAESSDDYEARELARRYLKAFADRGTIMAEAREKISAVRALAPVVQSSRGAILFTSRVETAEALAEVLTRAGVTAAPIHSKLGRRERHDRLAALKRGAFTALVAPTILDEGIDVPDVDLGIVLGGSRSRRQMIQRMGRVLRAKRDQRKATFVVVYARGTVEDLSQTNGSEGALDLILETADEVEQLRF